MTNIAIDIGHRNSAVFPLTLVIFHSYVSLPKGKRFKSKTWLLLVNCHHSRCWTHNLLFLESWTLVRVGWTLVISNAWERFRTPCKASYRTFWWVTCVQGQPAIPTSNFTWDSYVTRPNQNMMFYLNPIIHTRWNQRFKGYVDAKITMNNDFAAVYESAYQQNLFVLFPNGVWLFLEYPASLQNLTNAPHQDKVRQTSVFAGLLRYRSMYIISTLPYMTL